MATINRSDVIQKAVNDLGLSTSADIVPTQTLDKVQCTFSLNRQFSNFLIAGGQTTTGSVNVAFPTVSTGAETYITGATLTMVKDSTNDNGPGHISLSVTPDATNVQTQLLSISVLALTAQDQSLALSFPYPLKVKNGSNASLSGTYTAGTMSRRFTVTGFTTSSN